MKQFQSIIALTLFFSLLTFSACKKDKDDDTRTVEYKVMCSPETSITTMTFTDEFGDNKVVSGDNRSDWSSGERKIPNSINTLKLTAQAPGLAQSTMSVQILVDGEIKKEQSIKGPNNMGNMVISATY